MEGENIYNSIQEKFGKSPITLSILEETVDIELQMEYSEYSKKIKKDLREEAVLQERNGIYDPEWTEEQKKELFASLASIANVEAYRFIEKYLNEGHIENRNWAILALQESRMLLESKFLEEDIVFISTGLGGKGSKLRYFIVLISKQEGEFTDLQRKIIRNEFEIILKKKDAEIEKLDYSGIYATMLTVIPLKVSLKDLFKEGIRECNQYGNFLKPNFLITNLKELGPKEIKDYLQKQDQANKQENKQKD